MSLLREKVLVFTDGACEPNPGFGGWGVCIVNSKQVHRIAGCEDETTNNRMELLAVIKALTNLPLDQELSIEVITDSSYVANGMSKWMWGWEKKGWKISKKVELKNKDLWQRLHRLALQFDNLWVTQVKGHSRIVGNELADELSMLPILENIHNFDEKEPLDRDFSLYSSFPKTMSLRVVGAQKSLF